MFFVFSGANGKLLVVSGAFICLLVSEGLRSQDPGANDSPFETLPGFNVNSVRQKTPETLLFIRHPEMLLEICHA